MLCEICGIREGITRTVRKGAVERTVCICRTCQAKQAALAAGQGRPAVPPPAYEGARPRTPTESPLPAAEHSHVFARCSVCGTTTDDFENTLLVGCEHCYVDLAPAIAPFVRRYQPSSVHVGAAPSSAETDRGSEYEYLRTELERAIKEYRFLDAAEYKRRLDGLKGGGAC